MKIEKDKKEESYNEDILNELEKTNETKSLLIMDKLTSERSNKLLFKNFNTLTPTDLSSFNIKKKFSEKEAYFYFLEYIIKVIIIEETSFENKNEKKNKKKLREPTLVVDFTEENIKFEKKINNNNNNNDIINYTEEQYESMIIQKNINIDDYFIIPEKISFQNLRKKIKDFLEKLTFRDTKKNYFPDFQSELYFHFQLENVLMAFKECDESEFPKKINLIKSLDKIIYKIRDNQIKEKIILQYVYFVIDVEYEIESAFQISLIKYYDEIDYLYKDAIVNKSENKLIIKDSINSDIVIENFDLYKLNEGDISNIKAGLLTLPLNKGYYSLKGILTLREFNFIDGDIFYEKFISSKLIKDIFIKLYNKEFNEKFILSFIKLFQENTLYFPIENESYSAYTDKNCFKIFINYGIDEKEMKKLGLNDRLKHFIRKASFNINLEHEFGHGHLCILFYTDPINQNFDSPIVKMKLNSNKEKKTKEGGKFFEYLLYGRVIDSLNLKEIIYINNYNNFSKDLKKYRGDFLNLKNEKLWNVFYRESKNNYEIATMFKIYNTLPEKARKKLEKKKFKFAKRINDDIDYGNINLDNITFSFDKLRKSHYRYRKKFLYGYESSESSKSSESSQSSKSSECSQSSECDKLDGSDSD